MIDGFVFGYYSNIIACIIALFDIFEKHQTFKWKK